MFGSEAYLIVQQVPIEQRRSEPIQRNIYTDRKKAEERLTWDKGKKIVKIRLVLEE